MQTIKVKPSSDLVEGSTDLFVRALPQDRVELIIHETTRHKLRPNGRWKAKFVTVVLTADQRAQLVEGAKS